MNVMNVMNIRTLSKDKDKDSRQKNKLSESISKRNYSANITKLNYQSKIKTARTERTLGDYPNQHMKVQANFNNETIKVLNIKPKQDSSSSNQQANPLSNNLERFIQLNQQFKEKDEKKRFNFNRKITSAEPNVQKNKLNQQLKLLLNNNYSSGGVNINKQDKQDRERNSNQTKINFYKASVMGNANGTGAGGKSFINIKNFNYVFMNNDQTQLHSNLTLNKAPKSKYLKLDKAEQSKYMSNLSNNDLHETMKVPIKTLNFKNISPFNKQHSSKAYKEYYVILQQNSRETMEDFHLINEEFNNKVSQSLFGVFDGHGGIEVANKIKDELSQRFMKGLNQKEHEGFSIESIIKLVFKKLDEDILKLYTPEMKFETTKFSSLGSTATMVYLIKEEEYCLYCANLGDSRSILISKNGFSRITYEHKANDDFENKRVKDSGGIIFGGRLFGQFNLTRSFGDAAFKKWVLSEPFIKKVSLTENDRYVIIASDGLWDVVSDEECFEMSFEQDSAKGFCENLVNTAINRWSKDNISCIVIKLNASN